MKEPSYAIITDPHINDSNVADTKSVLIQAIDKCVELELEYLIISGDIFTERKNQTLAVLNAFDEVLDYAQEQNIEVIAIPGNHDKLDYTSESSYLDMFRHHPAIWLIRDYQEIDLVDGLRLHLIPFFDEKSTYSKYLEQVNLLKGGRNVLITHIAVNGVQNNDGSKVEEGCSVNSFKQFDAVYVGHYHDKQKVSDNIYYIGAALQKNFGEDEDKGMTIVYDDGSHKLHKLNFTKFQTVDIDVDNTSQKMINKLCAEYGNSSDHIRFRFKGDREKLDSIDRRKFEDLGITTDFKYKEVEVDVSYNQAQNFSGFDKEKIVEEWEEFSENNDYDQEIGIKYLEKI